MRSTILLPLFAIAVVACGDDTNDADQSAATGSSSHPSTTSGATGGAGTGGATGSGGATTTSSGAGGSGGSWPVVDYCGACGAPTKTGNIANPVITEASGIAASLAHADLFYVHNDSGDSPRFFAIDPAGSDLGTWNVTGAKANDWEDMARGPCESGSCLYFGDIGNNASSPSKPYAVYRVAEPAAPGPGTFTAAAETLPFAYPTGFPNAETLLVHPVTGVITIVTKVGSGVSSVFEFPMPLTPGTKATLVKVGELAPSMGDVRYTGGDVHPGGLGVLLRTYTHAFYFAMTPDQSVGDALAGVPCVVPSPGGGEAIGWLPTGLGYVGVPEGASAPITNVTCGP